MQVEFRYRFEAAHRFLKSDSIPCMTPHGHTWWATLTLDFTEAALNDSQMTVEFSEIKKDWSQLIQGTFDHSYMHNWNDPIVEVLKGEDTEPRLMPFPGDPTTEVIALFMFSKMDQIIKASPHAGRVEVSKIRIDETPTNSIVCDRRFYEHGMQAFNNFSGWWLSTDPKDRRLEPKN